LDYLEISTTVIATSQKASSDNVNS